MMGGWFVGVLGVLLIGVLILANAALINYLFFSGGRDG